MSEETISLAALQRLLELIGGDPADLDELLEDFRTSAPEFVAGIRAAATTGDRDALRIAAHTLKSNARDVGAMRLSSLCEVLERNCREGEVHDPIALADEIAAEEARARQALVAVSASDLES